MRLTRTPVGSRDDRRTSNRWLRRGDVLGHHEAVVRRADPPACTGSRRPASDHRAPPTSEADDGLRQPAWRRVLLVAGLTVAALVASGATAHADTVVYAIAASVDAVLTNIRNWLMGILAGLATVFLTIGGVRRVFGGGDPGEQEKAKEAFKAAGIGYALAALAPLVVTVLKGIVGA